MEYCGSATIEPDDYRIVKTETEERIEKLQNKLNIALLEKPVDVSFLWKSALSTIFELKTLYAAGIPEVKRKVISSIFPENYVIYAEKSRTQILNEAVKLISMINKELSVNNREASLVKKNLFQPVTRSGLEPELTEPESVVLPLYYRAIECAKIISLFEKIFKNENKNIKNFCSFQKYFYLCNPIKKLAI